MTRLTGSVPRVTISIGENDTWHHKPLHTEIAHHAPTAGPAGVGVAVGRAVRTSIVAINVLDLLLSMAIWGAATTVRLAG